MNEVGSQAGFALMDPAFLRVLAGEPPPPRRSGARARFGLWRTRSGSRWSAVVATFAKHWPAHAGRRP